MASLILLSSCSATGPSNVDDGLESRNYSGFLADYSHLTVVDSDDSDHVQRYVSPLLSTRGYTKLMLDPISFYPAPPVTDQASAETLTDIANYANQYMIELLKDKDYFTTEPGENTLRLKVALTAVSIQNKELRAYQYIPIAFVANAVRGGLNDLEIALQVESETVDSLTGEPLMQSVRRGVAGTLDSAEAQLTVDSVKPLLERWSITAEAMSQQLFDSKK
ncbi:MAG: DUF3313 domain-containing protein [Thalassotalea sp.]|nr:DUF3313 domain-containing protein [Thalassotalea sp.]